MTLREKIEACIKAEPDAAKASVLVFVMLDEAGLSLFGNGWDQEDAALSDDAVDGASTHLNALRTRGDVA